MGEQDSGCEKVKDVLATAETQKLPTGEPAAVQTSSKGLSCPKCSSTDIRRPFGWGAFGISIVVFFVGGEFLELWVPSNFMLMQFHDAACTCILVSVIWIFCSAAFGKNRCKACKYSWKGKA